MAQFDVHAGVGRTETHVVELQSDLLHELTLRIVAPMVPSSKTAVISGLTPLIPFQGREFILLTYQLAAIPIRELQHPVGSIFADQDVVKRALDILFLGF